MKGVLAIIMMCVFTFILIVIVMALLLTKGYINFGDVIDTGMIVINNTYQGVRNITIG